MSTNQIRDDQIRLTNLPQGRLVNASGIVSAIRDNLAASAAPTGSDNFATGYAVGSLWIYAGLLYVCTGNGAWAQAGGGGGGGSLAGLSDTNITSPANDQLLKMQSGKWTNVDDPLLYQLAGSIGYVSRTLRASHQDAYRPPSPLPGYWKVATWQPPGNSTTVPGVDGMPAMAVLGTATARTVATTNRATRMTRLGYVSNATAGSLCGQYHNVAQLSPAESGTGKSDGFAISVTFAVADASIVSNARMFIGANSVTPSNASPNTGFAMGIFQDGANEWSFLCRGGSIDDVELIDSVNFPISTGIPYNLTILSDTGPANNQRRCVMTLTNLETKVSTTYIWSAHSLYASTLLSYKAWRCNYATAAAVALDIARVSISSLS